MFRILFLIVFTFTTDLSFADIKDETSIRKMTEDYILAIANKDKDSYVKNVSKKYLKEQEERGFVKRIFKDKPKKKKTKMEFDLKSVKAAKTPSKYFINVKDKSQKEYDDEWFIVIKNEESQWVIDGVHHMED